MSQRRKRRAHDRLVRSTLAFGYPPLVVAERNRPPRSSVRIPLGDVQDIPGVPVAHLLDCGGACIGGDCHQRHVARVAEDLHSPQPRRVDMHGDGWPARPVLDAVNADLVVGVRLLARDRTKLAFNPSSRAGRAERPHLHRAQRPALSRDISVGERQIELHLVHLPLDGNHPTARFVVAVDRRPGARRPTHQQHLHGRIGNEHITGIVGWVGRVPRHVLGVLVAAREPACELTADAADVVLRAVCVVELLGQHREQRAERVRLRHERASVRVDRSPCLRYVR
eukprot:scaffold26104_cov122-Isochrysis_galbana.AAC.9